MAYGDVNYKWVNSGSTGASANTAHNLFGLYQGLSDLNQAEVIHIQLNAITNDYRIGPIGQVTNDTGLKITTVWLDLPPMCVALASQLQLINETAGTNASAMWVIWKRAAL